MDRIAWKHDDTKAKLPPGPWQDEPDKLQWPDEATGLPCLIVRGPLGALCGYVGVASGHALFEVDYNDCAKPAASRPNPKREARRRAAGMSGPGWKLLASPSIDPKTIELHEMSERLHESLRSRHEERRNCGKSWCSHSPGSMLEAHGGITFSGPCFIPPDGMLGICHTPSPGEPEHVWWFGFDCAHGGDAVPGMPRGFRWGGEYRDVDYVRGQCANLAGQLAAMK